MYNFGAKIAAKVLQVFETAKYNKVKNDEMGVFYTNAIRFCYISQNNSHLSLGSAPSPCEEHFHESVLWFWVVKA